MRSNFLAENYFKSALHVYSLGSYSASLFYACMVTMSVLIQVSINFFYLLHISFGPVVSAKTDICS